MIPIHAFSIMLFFSVSYSLFSQSNWPEPSGPNKNWILESQKTPPTDFSVRTQNNISWTLPLPEGGQSGIAIWEDRLFLSTFKPFKNSSNIQNLKSADILGICVDIKNKKILWEKEILGTSKSPSAYGFSDSTSPGPITDGKHVWFYNASGKLTCYDFEGKEIWSRNWTPIEELNGTHYPFNKQFEPILYQDTILNMETYWKKDHKRVYGWNYLVALNKQTGKVRWWSEDPLTQYNTPTYSKTDQGIDAVLIGRGGHHSVPETPSGYSLINLKNGTTLWRYIADEGNALFNSTWNAKIALWLSERENTIHLINSQNGTLLKKLSLTKNSDLRTFNTTTQRYVLEKNINLSKKYQINVFPAWFSNIIVGKYCYFICFKKSKRLKLLGPQYCLGRINLNTSKSEYLEVPVQYNILDHKKQFIWKQDLSNQTLNSRGFDIAYDRRSKSDGWCWNFNANPICINNTIYFTLMSGMVYCIDASRDVFDETSLLGVNDLGPRGNTWSLSTPSFADGKLFHRTLKNLICIEQL